MKRILIIFLAILTLLTLLVGCKKKKGNDETTAPETEPAATVITDVATTAEATEPVPATTEGETLYEVKWVLQSGVVRTNVKAGEMPVPPEGYDLPVTGETKIYTFRAWDKELNAVTGEAVYTAQYDFEYRLFDVTFVVDGVTTVVPTRYGDVPVYSGTPAGKYVLWETVPAEVTGEVTYTGTLLDDRDDMEYLEWALRQPDMYYTLGRSNDNTGATLNGASSLFYLVYLMRNEDNLPPVVLDKINSHLAKVLGGEGYEPMFQCCCMWNYPVLIASLTLAKATPAIWDQLSADTQERIDFMMKCFTVVAAFGTDDENNYSTGPDFYGNFGKGWNPNYRLANVTNILFAVPYFGSSQAVNDILLDFDYDAYIAKFDEYNWTAAKESWSKESYERADGTFTTSSKEVMMNGGTAYFGVDLERNGQYRGNEAGSGVGVRTTYSYQGYTLDQIPQIINHLLRYNYSGGAVFSSYSENGNKIAYILDGTTSPVEGKTGMMLEFNSGDGGGKRVSASYCMHDIIMIVLSLEAFEELGVYNIEDYYDVFDLAYVGNVDLIYKLEHGFMSYSLGAPYETWEKWGEGYMLSKKLWNENFVPRYVVETEERTDTYNPISANAGTTQSLAPTADGANLKYDLNVAGVYSKSHQNQYTSDTYMIWDFEYLVGPTAKETDFYIRDGAANKKSALLNYLPIDGVSTFRFNGSEYPVADGWHRVTLVVNETNEGQAITLHVTFYLDGTLIGTLDKTPVADDVLYKVDADGNPTKTPKETWFYIYMSYGGQKRDGYVTIRNSSLGVATAVDALPISAGAVTYVLNGGSFVAGGSIERKAFTLSDATVVPAYTHAYTDINNYYTTGTLAGNEFIKRAIFVLPDGSQVFRDGYALEGWYLDEALTVPYSRDALNGQAITLYAKWKVVGGNLTFNPGDGTFASGATLPRSYKTGDAAIALPTPSAPYASFDGWFTSSDFSGEGYKDSYPLAPDQFGSITFYAKWTPTGAKINYLGIGEGTLSGEYDDAYSFGATSVKLPTTVEREGFLFAGWYTSSDLSPASRVDGFTYAISPTLTEELNFYAAFTQTGAPVSYQTLGDLTGSYTKFYPINATSVVTLPTTSIPGYTFLGWYTSADFAGDALTTSYALPADEAVDSGITFYAKFVGNVTIDATTNGFTYDLQKKSENMTFTNSNGTARFAISKSGVSDLYFQVFGLTNRLGVYAVEFKISKPTEESAVLPITFRIHSKSGSAGSTPRRSESHVFQTNSDGSMTLFTGENAVTVGTVTTTPQTVTLLLDYASEAGKVSAVCYVDGVKMGEGTIDSGIMNYYDAVALYSEEGIEAYHYPDKFYVYAGSGSVGELLIDDFYTGEGYLPTGTGDAYNTKYLQTFGN